MKEVLNCLMLASFAISFLGCNAVPELVNFDRDLWMSDPQGCKNLRISAFQNFTEDKDQFIGLTERDIVRLLGKPDRQELYKRNQKFYFYYISPGGQCEGTQTARGQQIYLRISATQRITEVNRKN